MKNDDVGSNRIGNYLRKKRHPCYELWKRVTILYDGRVVPCCFDFDGELVLGDLKEQSLKEIWNGKKMKNLRRLHLEGKINPINLCRECKEKEGYASFFSNPFIIFRKILTK